MSNPARLNNGSQHVGSKTGAKACAIKGHNLNLCQTPLGWTTGHNLNICQTPLSWTTGQNLNMSNPARLHNGSQHVGSKTGAKACAIKDHNLCCHRANCMVPRQKTSSKKWEIYHSTAMNGKNPSLPCGTTWCLLWIPACMFASSTQVWLSGLLAALEELLPHWRSSGHRRSWHQHALCWKALATHYLCLL